MIFLTLKLLIQKELMLHGFVLHCKTEFVQITSFVVVLIPFFVAFLVQINNHLFECEKNCRNRTFFVHTTNLSRVFAMLAIKQIFLVIRGHVEHNQLKTFFFTEGNLFC